MLNATKNQHNTNERSKTSVKEAAKLKMSNGRVIKKERLQLTQ